MITLAPNDVDYLPPVSDENREIINHYEQAKSISKDRFDKALSEAWNRRIDRGFTLTEVEAIFDSCYSDLSPQSIEECVRILEDVK